ncbi:MAG: GGDEF domain-containing protein [bacterium]
MIFGRRRRSDRPGDRPDGASDGAKSADPSATGEASAPVPADRALDLVAELLRAYGEQAFDLEHRSAEQIRQLFEAWARHLLVGLPAPPRDGFENGAPAAGDQDRSEGTVQDLPTSARPRPESAEGRRDLPGLRLAFHEHRRRERDYVTSSLSQFREAAWSFISGLRRSLSVEQASDRRIGYRMRRLEGAIRGGEAPRIKTEAQEMVTLLAEFLAERGSRQQAQIVEMAARLESLRDELDHVRARAAIDGLTGLYNRAAFDEQIEREIDLATLFGRRACLILIDIDHFKWVNDNHGHACGDEVLRRFAETLSRCFMRRDDFLARYGGEEFVVVLRDIEPLPARDLGERAMNTIRNLEIAYDGLEEPIRLTASMGVAQLRPGESATAWIERTDRALYRAKDLGRDRLELDPIDVEST